MPDDPAPLAKPSAPSPVKDPPGIAEGVMDKDKPAPPPRAPADQARLDEELEGLDNLPSAAEEG